MQSYVLVKHIQQERIREAEKLRRFSGVGRGKRPSVVRKGLLSLIARF